MGAFKIFLFLSSFVFKMFDDVGGDCILSIKTDFGVPSPVIIHKNSYLSLGDNGKATVKKSEPITVACPGSGRSILLGNTTSRYDVLEAHCISGSIFEVDGWAGPFKDIRCNGRVSFSSQPSDKPCYRPKHRIDGATRYRVGYQIKTRFYPLYESCFDAALLQTRYVQHTLSPSSIYIQPNSTRLRFTEGGLYGKIHMNEVYRKENQVRRIDTVFGHGMGDQYITKKQFLNRGHLAPRADFVLQAENRATFHYINTAPQWSRGNAGDWAALEDALRRRVASLGRPVRVLTGTHGVAWLSDSNKQPHDFYLHTDENNNQLVPVPLYFYKLVYDSKAKTATAFISINSSFYNASTIADLTFCDDVCEDNPQFSWLKWRSNDGTFSFCCNYNEFTREIDYFDKLDVEGLFY